MLRTNRTASRAHARLIDDKTIIETDEPSHFVMLLLLLPVIRVRYAIAYIASMLVGMPLVASANVVTLARRRHEAHEEEKQTRA